MHMEMETISMVGAPSIAMAWIVKEVVASIRKSRETELIKKQIQDLWDWHNVTDPNDGSKIWYVKKSLESAIIDLSKSISLQTELFREFMQELKNQSNQIEYMHKDIRSKI